MDIFLRKTHQNRIYPRHPQVSSLKYRFFTCRHLWSSISFSQHHNRPEEEISAAKIDSVRRTLHRNLQENARFIPLTILKEAEKCYQNALNITPIWSEERLQAASALAFIKAQSGDIDAAIELWEQVVKTNPSDAAAKTNLETAYRNRNPRKDI